MDPAETRRDAVLPGALLLVNADRQGAMMLAEALQSRGYPVTTCERLPETLDDLSAPAPSAAVLDYSSLAGEAACAVRALRALSPDIRIILLSDIASLSGAVACIKAGADEFLTQPVSADEIDTLVRTGYGSAPLPRVTSLAEASRLHAHATLRGVENNLPAAARLLRVRPLTLRRLLDLPEPASADLARRRPCSAGDPR
ncbi:response regulator [Methylobacterium brachiatum]|jgi:two-component system response regulator RegA|uniref:response regulator n=1 Tax=Methylobacterium brachiatum TaxID=269660 RepID=UPI002448DE2A|nr:response regulator [Methylobacterium brachiatum]MDH2309189.1 response regulator [Methylobacterium brachiatum]